MKNFASNSPGKQSYKIEQQKDPRTESLKLLRSRGASVEGGNRMLSRAITRVISFTSGKGGVGKTTMLVNVAVGLAREGKSVLILDADLGLANVDVILGLRPRYTLQDVFEGRRSLQDIIITGPEGISIIPAASGVESICNLTAERRLFLMECVENLGYSFDYILIDTQAGIGPDVMYFNSASSEIVCVINPEPTSLTDAYALIKVLSQSYGEKSISVLANEVVDEKEGLQTFRRLEKAVTQYLKVQLHYLGCVPVDMAMRESVRSQRAVLERFPSSPAGLALARLSRMIDSSFRERRVKGGMQFFFRQLLQTDGTEGVVNEGSR